MIIGGFQKSSLIDFPGCISAVIFTQGCNFRCPYCHNPELISPENPSPLTPLPQEARGIIGFLKTRVGKLDGVVITGGEPTLHGDLPEFIREIRGLGFKVKLDTNGSNPGMLKSLLDENLLDYVAMDIKAPIDKYEEVVCFGVDAETILNSIDLLKTSSIDFEFRTTIVKSQLAPEDFEKIGEMIKGAKKYYLQKFVPTKTLNKTFMWQETYSDEEFELIAQNLQTCVEEVILR